MKNKKTFKIAIIGLGMVGTAIGHLLSKSGHKIVAISDKSSAALKRAVPYTGGISFRDSKKAILEADCILITTPDDFISEACEKIADSKLVQDKFVFHMSGAGSLDFLKSAETAGALTAVIHPLQSFSSIDTAISNIPGSVFGITASKKAQKNALVIVRNLNGIPIFIKSAQKPLYHAAACIASNYMVSLLNIVEIIYESIGISNENARRAYLPLIYGTLHNIEQKGSIQALTGPIARGDEGTIKKHILALDKNLPQYLSLYSSLGLITTDIAQKKGTLSSRQAKNINDFLKGVIDYEHSK
ncbi:MAG: DUF2520 domain-containing protein [Smithella sp.]